MFEGKTFLAIIPARSGSKGLKDKNIKMLCGKPLMAWSIQAGLESRYIDEIVVSTDSKQYAEIASQYGAQVPFLRPKHLSLDESTTFSSIQHTIDFYKHQQQKEFDYIVLLEPTSPLREAIDIDRAIEMLLAHPTAQSIVGISKTESQNPEFLIKLNAKNFIESYTGRGFAPLRRQEIKEIFFLEGTIYISQTQALLEYQNFYHQKTLGYEVPKWKSLEVDDEDDFVMIEAMAKKYLIKKGER